MQTATLLRRKSLRVAPLFAASLLAAAAFAAPVMAAAPDAGQAQYEPQVGQAGKDVVWVPTPQALVDKMLDMSQAKPGDFVVDLGSGDGRTVITAAKRGITAHGVEFNPDMVALAERNAKAAGVADKATFTAGDLFQYDLSKADVITMFLLPSINERLKPELLKLNPGTRIVANSFRMGDWTPDEEATVGDGCTNWCTALLWIVPANVAGSWSVDGKTLKLEQINQELTGTLGDAAISDARMLGNQISFTADGKRYTGTLEDKVLKGTVEGGGAWHATRA
ncbi:methyltransferase domain-containing protein [Achromobacter sp. GG226]|uniref:SAM-dependent methyltransferase n=1 Tax=Verticiella alkaliphila TaxID=2779529 RepID=UPI001C0B6190|nr:methyltransferase domain-containing protein [Verticiella sp. GG226]MBU4609608.1 methyltransferase domain-containing protein [Verticiella sp. GG226]